jgi:hypothetical protein
MLLLSESPFWWRLVSDACHLHSFCQRCATETKRRSSTLLLYSVVKKNKRG